MTNHTDTRPLDRFRGVNQTCACCGFSRTNADEESISRIVSGFLTTDQVAEIDLSLYENSRVALTDAEIEAATMGEDTLASVACRDCLITAMAAAV